MTITWNVFDDNDVTTTNYFMSSFIECPIELDWEHSDTEYITTVSEYESYQNRKRRFEMRLSGITTTFSTLSYDDVYNINNSTCINYDYYNVRRYNLHERRQRIAYIRNITINDVSRIEQERKIVQHTIM